MLLQLDGQPRHDRTACNLSKAGRRGRGPVGADHPARQPRFAMQAVVVGAPVARPVSASVAMPRTRTCARTHGPGTAGGVDVHVRLNRWRRTPSWWSRRVRTPPPALKASGRSRRAGDTCDLLQGPFWQQIPAYADVSEADFLDHQLAGEALDHARSRKLLEALRGPGVATSSSSDADAGLHARADDRARLAVPALAHRLDATPTSDPLRLQFIPLGSRAPARSPEARTSTRCTSGPTRRSPGSPTATPTRRCSCRSTPARSTAASARAATRSASTPRRSRRSSLKVERRALAAGLRLHRLAPRARGHRHLRAATPTTCAPSRSPRSARRCWRCPTSAGSASRPRARR